MSGLMNDKAASADSSLPPAGSDKKAAQAEQAEVQASKGVGQRISEAIYGEDSAQDKAANQQGKGVGQRISEVVRGGDGSQDRAASQAKDAGRTTWEQLQSGAATAAQGAKGKLTSRYAGGCGACIVQGAKGRLTSVQGVLGGLACLEPGAVLP